MQHLRHILHTKVMLNKLKKSRLLKAGQSFTTHYCYQFICSELFPSFAKAYLLQSYTHETKLQCLWQHKTLER